MELEVFKKDCYNNDPIMVVQKHLLEGSSHFFDKVEIFDEYVFKKDLSSSLDIHLRDIAIVGSGKLGFSVKPEKNEPNLFRFRGFDENHRSDLDVAIVSPRLFDIQLRNLYKYTESYTDISVWNNISHKKSLGSYILKGWLRPDLVPAGYKISPGIDEICAAYKMKFGRDVNFGIYKSWYYFETYHYNNIRNIKLNLIANG